MNQEATNQTAEAADPKIEGTYTFKITSPKAAEVGGTHEYECTVKLGADLDESVELFGADNTHNAAIRQWQTDIGNSLRRLMNPDEEKDEDGNKKLVPGTSATKEELDNYVSNWRPGMKAVKKSVDPTEALIAKINSGNMDREEMKKLYEAMRNSGLK